jgi:YegS/Rv2252/BmrU family lipid kinase
MIKKNKILVIVNPSSGVAAKDITTSVIFSTLRKYFDTVSIINSNSPEHGMQIAKDNLKAFDIITAFGGDGTINSIAKSLVGTDTVLGILPGGSGNGMVRNLHIPLSWRKALDVLINGKDVKIDVGKINDDYFFNVAGIGLDGEISKRYSLDPKSRGIFPYIYHAFKGYFEMPTFRVNIDLGDFQFQDEIMLIAFANFKQYGGKAVIAPFASPYDKELDLCILNKFKLLKVSVNIQKLFTGNIHKLPFYKSYKFKKVTISSLDGNPIPSTIDGEYGGKDLTEYKIEVIPEFLNLRVPN